MPRPGELQRSNQKFIVFEQFQKLNTQSVRQALKEGELAWLENLQPIAPNNLAAVPGPAKTALATLSETASTMFYAFMNGTDYLVVFTTAGAAFTVNIATGVISQFAPDGTFSNPDLTTWQGQRLLIADPKAGYSTFDGNVYVNTGGVSPNITVTNGGAGYSPSSPPSVTISGGSGTGATAHAVVGPTGAVISVVLDNPGVGYLPGDTLTVTFGTSPGSGAAAHAVMTGYSVTSLSIANPNFFSASLPSQTLVFSGSPTVPARGSAGFIWNSGTGAGTITSVALAAAGFGYTSTPTVTFAGQTTNISAHIGKQSVA